MHQTSSTFLARSRSCAATYPGACLAEQVGVNAPGRPKITMRLPLARFETSNELGPTVQPGVSFSTNSCSVPSGSRSPTLIAIEILRTRSKGDPEDLPTDLALLQSKVWTAQPGGLEALAQFTEPGTLGKSLVGEEGYENLNKALADLRKLTERLDRDEGLLGVLLSDKATADSFKKTIANLESVTDKAAHGQGLLPRLLEDKATVSAAVDAYAHVCGASPKEVRPQVLSFVRQGLATGLLAPR